MVAEKHFDPHIHITAGQLRRLGVYVQEVVPDRAFVRRIAVGFDDQELMNRKAATVRVRVLEEFQAMAMA